MCEVMQAQLGGNCFNRKTDPAFLDLGMSTEVHVILCTICVNWVCTFCVQDLLALVEMQRTLAELEGMAASHQHRRLSIISHGLASGRSGNDGAAGGSGAEAAADPTTAAAAVSDSSEAGPAKKPRLDQAPPSPGHASGLQNGGTVAPGAAAGSGTGSGADAASAGPESSGALSWSWPANGTIVLQRYGYSAAVLRCLSPVAPSAAVSAPSSASAARAAEAGAKDPFLVPSQPACIDLHMQWRDAGGTSAVPSRKGDGVDACMLQLWFAGMCFLEGGGQCVLYRSGKCLDVGVGGDRG